MKKSSLNRSLKHLPELPGIYTFKDRRGTVLYVGKSRLLKDRIRSYFLTNGSLTPAKQEMVRQVVSLDTIVTDTEHEALLLESTLIKKHRPPYNVILRDDKSYSYICIDYSKRYPEIYRIRNPRVTRYALHVTQLFGPFTSGSTAINALWIIKKYFPICLAPNKHLTRGCFNYSIHKCPGACLGTADPVGYRNVFTDIEQFLHGNTSALQGKLKRDIEHFAKHQQFEQAGFRKQLLLSIQHLHDRQKVAGRGNEHADYASFVSFGTSGCVNILAFRHGSLYDQKNFFVDHMLSPAETLLQVLERYYSQTSDVPRAVYSSIPLPANGISVESALQGKTIHTPTIRVQKGVRLELLKLSERNAQEFLFRHSANMEAQTPIEKLCQILRIPYHTGFRTEIFDVSHTQGFEPVGSMVVAIDSERLPKEYRKFKLTKLGEPNDFAHMEEVLSRRFRHSASVIPDLDRESKQKDLNKLQDTSYKIQDHWALPDLIVVDGGKGQLSIAKKILKTTQRSIPLIALAKREEEIFIHGKKEALKLPKTNPALKFLQMMRDEAHRFGIAFYRKRHRKALLEQ